MNEPTYIKQQKAILDGQDVTALFNIMHNKAVRLVAYVALLVIALALAAGVLLLPVMMVLGTMQLLTYGSAGYGVISWVWVAIQSFSIDMLLPGAIVFALITKNTWGRVSYSAVAVLSSIVAGCMLVILFYMHILGLSQLQAMQELGIGVDVFIYVRSALVVFALIVDTMAISFTVQKLAAMTLPGQVAQSFKLWLAGIFEASRIKRSIRVQKTLEQTGTLNISLVQNERLTGVQLNTVLAQPERSLNIVQSSKQARSEAFSNRSKTPVAQRIEHAFLNGGYLSVRDLAERSKTSTGSVHAWISEHHPGLLNK